MFEDSINTAHSVDSRLINTKFVSYNDQTPPPLTPFPSGLPPPFLHTASDQKLEAGMAWEQARHALDYRP